MSNASHPLYPSGPTSVPPSYVQPSSAYKRHAWLAVAGLAGFFLLYLGATVWFGWKAVRLARDAHASGSLLGTALAALAAFLFVFLAKALLPGKRTAKPEHMEVTPQQQPELFDFVHRIADEAKAPRPHRVFVTPEVNAAVFYDLTLLNLIVPSRKNLLVGVGLVNVLTLAEFKAVLAHEFGHFAQRAMAVGRWVYVGQQIAGRIIARRDAVDRLVHTISTADIRVAWLGWGLRILAWAIRALTESFFHLVILAERALSREMELQADRVAVSVAGSDALTHALFRLQAADAAWSQVETIAASQIAQGNRVPDLFALQTQALGELRRIFGDDEFGDVPSLPAEPDGHRIFTPALAQPPVMWASHPASHVREHHAKDPYIRADLDDRSAWVLFNEPELLRRQLTQRELDTWGAPAQAPILDPQDALDRAEERFDMAYLETRYRGVYLGRPVTRQAKTIGDLYGSLPEDPDTISSSLEDPYPESVAELVRTDRELRREKAQLLALEAGIADAPGRAIQHRGRTLERRELRTTIEDVEAECRATRAQLHAFDRGVRAAHAAAAARLGKDWQRLHRDQLLLLHFAEHLEADVDDAMGQLSNVFAVVTADGRITDSELSRLLGAATELFVVLEDVWSSRDEVVLGPAVAAWMEAESWADALGEPFGLVPPTRENIEDWLSVVESWHQGYSALLGRLSSAALEGLLDIEAHLRRCWLAAREPGPAPQGPTVNARYRPFVEGSERRLQTKLDWWDRFVTADGWGPGAARLGVATTVVGVATFGGLGGLLASPEVAVHNGLMREVVVRSGETTAVVPPAGTTTLQLDVDDPQVETRTTSGELIEVFDHGVDNAFGAYGYSVAGAVPLVEWTVVYGPGRPDDERLLGAQRWFASEADYVFTEPPESMSSREGSVFRTVVSAVDATDLTQMMLTLSMVPETEHERVALVHARWDELPMAALWLSFAHELTTCESEAREILAERRAAMDAPHVFLERVAQDFAEDDGTKATVCAEHEAWAEADPNDADAVYLALRCAPEDEGTDRAAVEALQRHPRHPWLLAAAGYAQYRLGDLDRAIHLLGKARVALPEAREMIALYEARLRRLGAELEGATKMDDLEEASMQVRLLAARERGEEGHPLSYRRLAAGRLREAVDLASDDAQRVLMLRLAAASSGASSSLLSSAAAVGDEAPSGLGEAVAGLIVARRTGSDEAPFRTAIGDMAGDDAPTLLAFYDLERLLSELDALEHQRKRLDPELRGFAAVLGLDALEDRAPEVWPDEARRLLFVGERPYIAEVADQAPAADTEAR